MRQHTISSRCGRAHMAWFCNRQQLSHRRHCPTHSCCHNRDSKVTLCSIDIEGVCEAICAVHRKVPGCCIHCASCVPHEAISLIAYRSNSVNGTTNTLLGCCPSWFTVRHDPCTWWGLVPTSSACMMRSSTSCLLAPLLPFLCLSAQRLCNRHLI